MSLTDPAPERDPDEYLQERLGPHRELLETLARMDTPLSEDAYKALQKLDDQSNQDE